MKLFYFLDFMHVKKYGTPITHDCYVNLEHGPIPSSILNLVNNVEDDIDNSELADTIKIEKSKNIKIYRVVASRKFSEKDEKYFSEKELGTLKKVCLRFGSSDTRSIKKASHKEASWRETRFLEDIPYTLAAKDVDCLVDEEIIKLLTNI